MPTPTYDLIASQVLSTSAASVTFSSIPGTYRDLILVADLTGATATSASANIRFNSDSGSNYAYVWMAGNGVSASSNTNTTTSILGLVGAVDTAKTQHIWQVMDYSATDKHTTTIQRSNRAVGTQFNSGTYAQASRWANTAAVTGIEIFSSGGNYAAGSTFYLYGIAG